VFENSSAPPAPVATTGNTAAPTSSAGGTGGSTNSAEQQVAADWTTFFNGHTGATKRDSLVQDGPDFLATIEATNEDSITLETVAQVTKVTFTSPTQANVSYSILLAGQPALPNQEGTAVLDDGVWKVSAFTFCTLLTLENGGSKKGLPPACTSILGSGSAG
jgi:hypothetical protein